VISFWPSLPGPSEPAARRAPGREPSPRRLVLLAPERVFKADAIAMQINQTLHRRRDLGGHRGRSCREPTRPARACAEPTPPHSCAGSPTRSSWSSDVTDAGAAELLPPLGLLAELTPAVRWDVPTAPTRWRSSPRGRARCRDLASRLSRKRPRSASCRPTFRRRTRARRDPRRDHGSRARLPGSTPISSPPGIGVTAGRLAELMAPGLTTFRSRSRTASKLRRSHRPATPAPLPQRVAGHRSGSARASLTVNAVCTAPISTGSADGRACTDARCRQGSRSRMRNTTAGR